MAPIFQLTIRQIASPRRGLLILALLLLPVLAAVLFHVADAESTNREFTDDLVSQLIISAILPLVMLVLASSSLGNEVDDRTLGFLVLKPIARWRIVLPKFAAPLLAGGVPLAISGFATSLIVMEGDLGSALAVGLGLLAGSVAYAAVFLWLGLTTRHSLVIGVVYVFVWEAALAGFLDGIRFLSVRQYSLAVTHGVSDASLSTIDVDLGLAAGIIGVAAVGSAFVLLTLRRLRTMDVP
jgi:ABC-2 type transport system permease protein